MRNAITIWNGQLNQISMKPISNALDCMHDQQIILINSSGGVSLLRLTQATTKGQEQEMETNENTSSSRKYVIRRLTPLECCRLQGFPDYWEDGVERSDSARYKMWGNGMALPCVVYVMHGIREVLSQ